MQKSFSIVLILFCALQFQAQELLTVGSEKVSKEEFLRIYQKNNNSKLSFSKKEINEYLDLFTLFKMKLQEAQSMRLDTLPVIKEDYEKYTNQLVQKHFVDKDYVENIFKKQYENMKYDVKVAHIMVKCPANASSSDSILAFNKIDFIKKKLNTGNFSKIASESSEDVATAKKGGELGWLTAFMTFPDFEHQFFNTPVGGLSPVFRTQYGYHILRVLDKRPARGRIKVAHIFRKKEDGNDSKNKMNEAYEQLSQKKISFEEAVKKYSEDVSTKETKGVLPEFGVSEMVADFENQCFNLKSAGDISKPFETDYGWHLVKLIEKKPIQSYEVEKNQIEKRMARDPRVNNLKGVAYQKILNKYKLNENKAVFNGFGKTLVDTFFMNKNWKLRSSKATESAVLFSVANQNYLLKDFLDYSNQNFKNVSTKKKIDALNAMYTAYKERQIWVTAKDRLRAEDKDYAALESEYMNGLLIFEIMDREVWKKAVQDTVGAKKLYEKVKNNYWFKKRAVLEGVKTQKSDILEAYEADLNSVSGKSLHNKILKSKDSNDIVYYENTIEQGDYPAVDNAMNTIGKAFVFKDNNKSYILAKVVKVLNPSVKPFDEIKGRVQNLYQNEIEKQWTADLRAKYPVKVNQKELDKIIKK